MVDEIQTIIDNPGTTFNLTIIFVLHNDDVLFDLINCYILAF